MIFSREYLRAILPTADPPIGYVPDVVLPSLRRLREREDEDVYRAGLWTYAMFKEIRERQFEIDGRTGLWPFRVILDTWLYPPFQDFFPCYIRSRLAFSIKYLRALDLA
jgi:hypothetical protein